MLPEIKFAASLVGSGVVGTAAGVGARAIYWHLLGVSVVDEKTLTPVGVIAAVCITLVSVSVVVTKAMMKLTQKLTILSEHDEAHSKSFDALNKRIDGLPCNSPACRRVLTDMDERSEVHIKQKGHT